MTSCARVLGADMLALRNAIIIRAFDHPVLGLDQRAFLSSRKCAMNDTNIFVLRRWLMAFHQSTIIPDHTHAVKGNTEREPVAGQARR